MERLLWFLYILLLVAAACGMSWFIIYLRIVIALLVGGAFALITFYGLIG